MISKTLRADCYMQCRLKSLLQYGKSEPVFNDDLVSQMKTQWIL